MPYQSLSLNFAPPIATITLTHSESGNLVNRRLLGDLREAIELAAADRRIRAAILTGSGETFSRGWDDSVLSEVEALRISAIESGLLGSTFQFLTESPLPIIAAINGDAVSAGLELALACDLRLASSHANFALPDIAEGRIPMAGATQRLPRIIGHARAVDLVLTGRTLTATEALEWGILNSVHETDGLPAAAERLAKTLSERGPVAVRIAKEAIYRGSDMPLEEALRYETDLTVLLQTTRDRAEGVQAFIDKHPPRFEGR
jgi:enoyl-CoA hydratase